MSEQSEFTPFERTSPFFDLIGPLLLRRGQAGPEFALEIDERHANARGVAHGGVLSALADVSLGYAAALSTDPPTPLHTVSLTIDFIAAVAIGETVTATPQVLRVGSRLAHATGVLFVSDAPVASASATLAVQRPAPR